MTIADESAQSFSITEETWRALRLFTNRRSLIRLFVNYINNEPPQKKILFFHGDGGNGKSLLMRYLREHYCKKFKTENWNNLKQISDNDEFLEQVKIKEEAIDLVPFVVHDFGAKPVGNDQPRDDFYGPLMLRRELAQHNFKFPIFDFACIWYLKLTNQINHAPIKNLFPEAEIDFVAEVFDAVSKTSYGGITKVIINIFGKHIKTDFSVWWKKRKLNDEQIEKIIRLEKDELVKKLPTFLADDCNTNLEKDSAPSRIILFFDTHESFWGTQRDTSQDDYFGEDMWLRLFLRSLELTKGIIVIVGGREQPRWAEAIPSTTRISKEFIDSHLVGHLTPSDAYKFLKDAENLDDEVKQSFVNYEENEKIDLRKGLMKFAEVETEEIHPLYLGLLLDIVIAAARRGKKLTATDFQKQPDRNLKEKDLVNRFLRYIDEEIRQATIALSACRAFNQEIFIELGKTNNLNFRSTTAAFEILKSFSFVWQSERHGEGWYRIHDLLRRLFAEHDKSKVTIAHNILEAYYKRKNEDGDEFAIVEAIYHSFCVDWKTGLREFNKVFEKSLDRNSQLIPRALIEVQKEMLIAEDYWNGRALQLEGDFYFQLSDYAEAKQKYTNAVTLWEQSFKDSTEPTIETHNIAFVWQRLGEIEGLQGNSDSAFRYYESSIESFDKLLIADSEKSDFSTRDSDFPARDLVLKNKGLVLLKMGELQSLFNNPEGALKSYNDTLITWNKAIKINPDDAELYGNKSAALMNLGQLNTAIGKHDEAINNFDNAIQASEKALRKDAQNFGALNNKIVTLIQRGSLETILSQHDNAKQNFLEAILSADKLLQFSPDSPLANNNKGYALLKLGELETSKGNLAEATNTFSDSLFFLDKALDLAPNLIMAHLNKADVLTFRGTSEALSNQQAKALQTYTDAINSLNKALLINPKHLHLLARKAILLQKKGELESILNKVNESTQSYRSVINTNLELLPLYEKAIHSSPEFYQNYNDKAVALLGIANIEKTQGNFDQALQNYHNAIENFDRVVEVTPELFAVQAFNNKSLALFQCGELERELGKHKEACQKYNNAITTIDEALKIDSNSTTGFSIKSAVFVGLGASKMVLGKHDQAIESFNSSINASNTVLQSDFERTLHTSAYQNKGSALANRGTLFLWAGKKSEACVDFYEAVEIFSKLLSIVPDNIQIQNQIQILKSVIQLHCPSK